MDQNADEDGLAHPEHCAKVCIDETNDIRRRHQMLSELAESSIMVLNLCICISACLQSLGAPTLSHCFYQPVDTKFDPRPAIKKIIKEHNKSAKLPSY
jgi:hypothetical protein